MRLLPVVALDGLTYAAWLFLVSAGLTFTYGVLRVLNLAHGNLYALGAYLGATLVLRYAATGSTVALGYGLLLVAAIAVGVVAGPPIEPPVLAPPPTPPPALPFPPTFPFPP